MEKIVDMSPDAVTNRMLALDSLWELSVALKSSIIIDEETESSDSVKPPSEQEDKET